MISEVIKEKVVKEAKRVENDAFYSSKGHFEAAHSWNRQHLHLGIPSTILSAVIGASALAQFDNHNIIAGFLAILVTVLSALSTFLNPGEKANSHQNAGTKFTAVRNAARRFYDVDIFREDIPEQELLLKLEELIKQRDELNQNSLPIPRSAYRKVVRRYGAKRGEN
jgi:hypothetical protein